MGRPAHCPPPFLKGPPTTGPSQGPECPLQVVPRETLPIGLEADGSHWPGQTQRGRRCAVPCGAVQQSWGSNPSSSPFTTTPNASKVKLG